MCKGATPADPLAQTWLAGSVLQGPAHLGDSLLQSLQGPTRPLELHLGPFESLLLPAASQH